MKAIWYSLYLFFPSVSPFVADCYDPLKTKKRQNSAMPFLESFPSKILKKKKKNNLQKTKTPPFSAIPDANVGL